MRRHPSRTRLFAGGLLAATVTAAFVPAAHAGRTDAAAAAAPPAFSVTWAACPVPTAARCGTMRVPVDWSKPHGAQITLALARRPADDPAHRVGTVFYNPGGPGDGAARYVVNAEQIFSATLRARFDIVGLDPRATGDSAPVRCGVQAFTPTTTLFPKSSQEFEALRRHNRELGLGCLRVTGALVANTDTVSVARDHEALRIALGVDQVNWLGISYGSQLAANYAQLYPRRTRAMVLDSALEHSLPEVVQVADEITVVEESFNRFARWCDTSPTCALRGSDVGAVFDRLVADADKQPIPVEGALRPVTGEDIRMGTIRGLTLKEPNIAVPGVSWAGLSQALANAVDGDASAFILAPAGVDLSQLNTLAVGCMEYVPQIHTYAQMRQRIQMGRQLAPHLQGASETWQVNLCIDWPVSAANPPRLLNVTGVPTLIMHSVYDPSDPYKWAHSLAAQIHGSDILTRTGDGHTSYYTSECARTAADQYLIRPQASPDRVCAD
jgi:pimeloyl-ACP methyl ester carboxylesterase